MKHYDITISGHVQGVNFRTEAKYLADRLKITGFIKNASHGGLEIEVEGEVSLVEEFLAWCRLGPVQADVDDVKVEESAIKGYDKFEIRY